jgi:hypothetical protein
MHQKQPPANVALAVGAGAALPAWAYASALAPKQEASASQIVQRWIVFMRTLQKAVIGLGRAPERALTPV